ncbi:head completion/stabilization protein [Lysobacter sp. TAF61]|uniref:head completion/stabilization protein n=1 Tax=Lysobacter sp. TAF61 TaxID=3233072 RepID=UPI003F9B15BF
MSGFVATAPITTAGGDADAMRSDGWFPDLSIAWIRATVRLDGTITEDRLRDAGRYAITDINRRLAAFKAGHVAAGKASLAAVASDEIDGENRLELLYRRAVACALKAEVIERFRDFDSTDAGLRRAEDLDASIGEQRRNSSWAVRDILGQPHSVIELI